MNIDGRIIIFNGIACKMSVAARPGYSRRCFLRHSAVSAGDKAVLTCYLWSGS